MNRRKFLSQSVCATVGAAAMSSSVKTLARMANAVSAADDYKALVCLFLFGGNDGDNCIIPRSQSEYNTYAAQRGALTIPRDQLLPLYQKHGDGREYGFNPSWPELQNLFNNGNLAVLANVGPLVEPTTRNAYLARKAKLPRSLFSHQDQQIIWSNARPEDLTSGTGWGGRLADYVNSINLNPLVSMSISVSGSNAFQAADNVVEYQVSPGSGSLGLSTINPGSNPDPISRAFREMLAQEHPGLFETEYNRIMNRAIQADQVVKSSLASISLNTQFPSGRLGSQLKMIARLIAARNSFGLKRQIFFCSLGSFDTHGDQLTEHPPLLSEVSKALYAFYSATVEMGIASQVTTFTLSDFGRTFRCNGKGSDHGWGSHHLILGGAVKGSDIYGKFPNQTINGPDDTDQGRWIPTTSSDQYASTLALWFGVPQNNLPAIVPNIYRFDAADLGFIS